MMSIKRSAVVSGAVYGCILSGLVHTPTEAQSETTFEKPTAPITRSG